MRVGREVWGGGGGEMWGAGGVGVGGWVWSNASSLAWNPVCGFQILFFSPLREISILAGAEAERNTLTRNGC